MNMIYDNIKKTWAINCMWISFVQFNSNPRGSAMAQHLWDLLLN